MKLIILFTFLLGYGCSGSLDKKQTADEKKLYEKECIDRIIAADDSLGKIRNNACKVVSLSESIQQYTSEMEKLNYKDCPSTFTDAFEKHRQSWIAMLAVTDKYPDLRGEMHELFNQLEQSNDSSSFKPLLKSIWDTWAEVEKVMNNIDSK